MAHSEPSPTVEATQLIFTNAREKITLGAAFDKLIRAPVPKAILTEVGSETTLFKATEYFNALSTKQLGRALFVAPSISSTQTFLNENLKEFKSVAVVADLQVSGKGRGANTWTSPLGCLMVSFSLVHRNASCLPHVQYLISLALVRAVKTLSGGNDLGLKLKWPNDIYFSDKMKIGGVLCQSSYDGQIFHVVSGVGINVFNALPTTCLSEMAKAVNPALEKVFTRERVLATFFNELEMMHVQLELQGFEPFYQEYLVHWLHSGQELTFKEGDTSKKVVIRGLTPSGFLLAEDINTPDRLELHPDSNSLNFWEGFISRKIN